MKRTALAAALLLSLSAPAFANLSVSFDEGAPKDRFTFKNSGTCAIKSAKLTLDLSGSKSGLIFDVTNAGAGVEVFQPLEMLAGGNAISKTPKIKDGDNKVIFDVRELKSGESIAFTIDVDDTMGGREITVSGSEIQGARVQLKTDNGSATGIFSASAKASVGVDTCA